MNRESHARSYKQTARAKAAEETGKRIIAAFHSALEHRWFDEIRLDDIAREAGVSVQTIIRRFGGKEGLLSAVNEVMEGHILEDRQLPIGNAGKAVDGVIAEYELRGDMVMRLLAQEERFPSVMNIADFGRVIHRKWVGEVFDPWLSEMTGDTRRDAHDRLVIALDLYLWKLLRKDMKRSKAHLKRTMLGLCSHALGVTIEDLTTSRKPKQEI